MMSPVPERGDQSAPTASASRTSESELSMATRRESLVASIAARQAPWGAPAWSEDTLRAMRTVPRHVFAPSVDRDEIYRDVPQAIGHQQTISQPTMVALMTEALELRPHHRVLEIGTGSGYGAAVLSRLARCVFTVERIAALGNPAREVFERLGYDNIRCRLGDGYLGWRENAPFDRIILTAAPPKLPERLLSQLAEGGLLIAPIGAAATGQVLMRWRKLGGTTTSDTLGAVRFVPMIREAGS